MLLLSGDAVFCANSHCSFRCAPVFFGTTNGVVAGIVALSLNSAAYIAEIFRAGIQSIDRGADGSRAFAGMTHPQAMRYVILPQAFKTDDPAARQ